MYSFMNVPVDAKRQIASHMVPCSHWNVWIKTFAFLLGIGVNHHIKAIKKHYLENGMEPRVYKDTKWLPIKTAFYMKTYWHL